MSWIMKPRPADFFPPTRDAWTVIFNIFRIFPITYSMLWTSAADWQLMGKTSGDSEFNLPGRWAWSAAEAVGPINMLYILYTLPKSHGFQPVSSTSFAGTGLPAQHEVLGFLYVLHYINRAGITPALAPSMSPIHPYIMLFMSLFQYTNSSNLGCWIVYSAQEGKGLVDNLLSPLAIFGLGTFFLGLAGNIVAEHKLFDLRRAAAKRKAKSEGKATITYSKVYVVPPAEGLYKYILSPHYSTEWIEWTGYYVLGGALGLGWGWDSAPLWFLINELTSMLPRAVTQKKWYENKFGKRAVAGRKAAVPFIGP